MNGKSRRTTCRRCGIKHGGRWEICQDCRAVDPNFLTRAKDVVKTP